jgi:hypothetical protein
VHENADPPVREGTPQHTWVVGSQAALPHVTTGGVAPSDELLPLDETPLLDEVPPEELPVEEPEPPLLELALEELALVDLMPDEPVPLLDKVVPELLPPDEALPPEEAAPEGFPPLEDMESGVRAPSRLLLVTLPDES